MSMADKIKKSSQAMESDKDTRESASKREHTKSKMPTSFRFSSETLTHLEDIRVAIHQETGRIPKLSEVVVQAISELHERVVDK